MTYDFDSLRQRVKAILMDLNIGNFGMYAQYAEPKTDAIMEALANSGRELQVRCYQAIKRAAAMLPMLADRDTKGRKTIDDFADELNELRIELDAVLGAEQSANRGREGQGGAGQPLPETYLNYLRYRQRFAVDTETDVFELMLTDALSYRRVTREALK